MEADGTLTASPVMLKPGVDSAYGHGWKQLWRYFGVLLLIGIIYFVISMASSIPQWIMQLSSRDMFSMLSVAPVITIFNLAYTFLIVNPLFYGMNYAYLKATRSEKVDVEDIFTAFRTYWNAVLSGLLIAIIISVGFVLLIVPGIILACKLVFVPFLVVDKKMEAIEAIKTSWRMTNGHAWKVFLMSLLAIPITIAGFICLGIGVIIAAMWIMMAFAALYYAVSLEQAAEQPAGI